MITSRSVSYTHLDVYKRQGLEEQITSFLYNHSDTGLVVIDTLQKVRSCDKSGSMYASDYKDVSALKSLADKYGICILPVSYTHLDVYKRQAAYLPKSGSMPRMARFICAIFQVVGLESCP